MTSSEPDVLENKKKFILTLNKKKNNLWFLVKVSETGESASGLFSEFSEICSLLAFLSMKNPVFFESL